jgi:hypothetical protein
VKVTRESNCYCHNCGKWFHYLGIVGHRGAHLRRGEKVKITYTHGNTRTHTSAEPGSDDPGEFGAGIKPNPKARYWQERADFWMRQAISLGYVAGDGTQRCPPANVDHATTMEGWHAAVNDASELFANATDQRFASRASRVVTWIKANRPNEARGGGEAVAWIATDNALQFNEDFIESGKWKPGVRFYTHPTPAALDAEDEIKVATLRIPRSKSLDPITVYLEDSGNGKGRAVIACYASAWVCSWGAMGNRSVREFIASCDEHYVSGAMLAMSYTKVTENGRDYAARVARAVIDAARATTGASE